MTKPLFYSLTEANNVALVGGKAAALAALIQDGLPVPNGIVIAVSAYTEHKQRAFRTLGTSPSTDQRAEAILTTPIDQELRRCVCDILRKQSLCPVAVRSSCTVEDSDLASFAGQFETFLGISDEDLAMDAVRKCWASLWSAHARAYGKHQHRMSDAGMGVIMQQMVLPEFAGVAFSIDPTAAHLGICYAEWVNGTGDSLVSGEEIAGRIWLDSEGNTLRRDSVSDTLVPPVALWREISELLTRVSARREQDIEWAWKDGQIFLLQSRPITQIIPWKRMEPAPWELIGRPHGGWSDAQRMLFDCWDEYNPPAIQPLEMDLFMGAIWQASLDMLDDGSGVPEIEKATVLIDGVPVQIDPTGGQIDNCNRWPRGEVRNDLLETMGWGAKMIRELRGQLEAAALPSSTDLLKALNECASVHRTLGVTRLRFMQTWIAGESDAKSALEPLLSRIDANTELLLEQLLAGVDTETRRMNQDLQSLAKQFNDKGTTQFSKALSEFLERYGHFQSDGIPLSETHESLLKQIRTIAESSDLKTTENIASRIAIVTNGICSKIPPESQESFRMALNDLRYWYNVREDSKTKVEIARPLLRELVIELGRRFVSEKVLSKAEQIWLLRSIEVQNAIRGLHTPDSAILERREALVAWKAKQSWLPGGFVTELCRPTDHEWKGLSGSPGKALGCVRLVNGPQEFGNVRNGEIVVARSTNPVWTQLFGQISAIIVENGSRLSHAAIVAREYGIPCVVGLPGITAALKTGELITVDGDAGKVFRSKQSVKVDHLN